MAYVFLICVKKAKYLKENYKMRRYFSEKLTLCDDVIKAKEVLLVLIQLSKSQALCVFYVSAKCQ